MALENFKIYLRRMFDFILTVLFFGHFGLLRVISRIEGLSSCAENIFLYYCAKCGPGEGAIVEIGSYKGRTTVALAFGSVAQKREKVYAIDPLFDRSIREQFFKNISLPKVKNYIIPVLCTSHEASKDFSLPIRLLFVDGSHSYEDAKNDITTWSKYLVSGGVIVVHDYTESDHPYHCPSVKKAVDECIVGSGEFTVEGKLDSMLFATKGLIGNATFFRRFVQFNNIRDKMKTLLDATWCGCGDT